MNAVEINIKIKAKQRLLRHLRRQILDVPEEGNGQQIKKLSKEIESAKRSIRRYKNLLKKTVS